MHKFCVTVEKDQTAVLEHDRFEYVRVYGNAIVNEGNIIHYITLFEGGEVQVNKMRGVDHIAILKDCRAILNKWESGCCIELHAGGTVVNATDVPTDELIELICLEDRVEAVIKDNTIIGIKKEIKR